MAVVLRLARAGAKKKPYYHVVATDSRNPRDGKFIEAVGAYDPNQKPAKVEFDAERLEHWLKSGATPSDTVGELIKRHKRAAVAAKPADPAGLSPDSVEQLIIYLTRALVNQPDQVSLRASEVDGARLYELKVAPEDVGKVIGRDGRTVGALRTLLGAAAQKQGQKVRLEIQDDRRQQGQATTPSPEGQ